MGAVVAGALLAWVAFVQEPQITTLTTIRVESPAWPENAAPLRIVFLSDIHVDGIHTTEDRVRGIAEAVTLMAPDVILLGGDYIGGLGTQSQYRWTSRPRRGAPDVRRDEAAIRALGRLRARYGAFAVMGNHDCWWDCTRMREIFAEVGIEVLSNSATEVERGGGAFWIVGLADRQTETPDFAAAIAEVPDGATMLALMHSPHLFDYPENHFPIQFTGHTHGGQVRFPIIGAPLRLSRHTELARSGVMIEHGRVLVVSRGLGEVGLPVRFGAPPQIMLIEIRHGQTAQAKVLS